MELLDHRIIKTISVATESRLPQSSPSRSKDKLVFSLLEVEQVAKKMRAEVFQSSKRSRILFNREAFGGSEGVTWLQNYFSFPDRQQAVDYGNMLVEHGFIVSTSSSKLFKDSNALFRFVEGKV